MLIDINKLNGKIAEACLTRSSVAKLMGIAPSTLYRKLQNGGATLLVKDAIKLAEILHLSSEECSEIFFARKVA